MKNLSFRLLLLMLALAFVLGTAEVGLRLLIVDQHPLASSLPYFDRSRFRYQAEAGREHPWTAQTAPSLLIAAIGDSITHGAGVLPYDRYGNRLEALLNLNEGVPPARVETCAIAGSSTFQQLRLLGEALSHRPQVVVLGICINDTEDWTKPDEFKAWRAEALPRPTPQSIRWSRLLIWLHGKKEALRTHHAHLAYYRRLYDQSYSGRHRFEQALDQFQKACNDAETSLIAVLFPALSWDLRKASHPLEFVHESQASLLATRRIPTIDLWRLFQGKETLRLEVIPGIDGHPNEIAHRLAAEAIYLYLLEHGHIGQEYRARSPESQFDYWEALQRVMQGLPPIPPDG